MVIMSSIINNENNSIYYLFLGYVKNIQPEVNVYNIQIYTFKNPDL